MAYTKIFQRFRVNYLIEHLMMCNMLENTHTYTHIGIRMFYCRSADQVLLNMYCGHVIRCKPKDADEGGIFSGMGNHSSVLVI